MPDVLIVADVLIHFPLHKEQPDIENRNFHPYKTNYFKHRIMTRGVYTMVRSHKATQNESNLLFLVTFFAIMTLSEPIKVSYSSQGIWLSVLEKI